MRNAPCREKQEQQELSVFICSLSSFKVPNSGFSSNCEFLLVYISAHVYQIQLPNSPIQSHSSLSVNVIKIMEDIVGITNFAFLISLLIFFYIGRNQAAFSVLHPTMPTVSFQTALRDFQSIGNTALTQPAVAGIKNRSTRWK